MSYAVHRHTHLGLLAVYNEYLCSYFEIRRHIREL